MSVTIYAKKGDYFSFFNSPYYSHVNASAVDIYPREGNSETVALSPVDGIISKVYEFKSPRPKQFKAAETDQLILVTPKENHNVYVRLLHIDCALQVGASISVGDFLGTLIRSGFFDFWTSQHIHIEVRQIKEFLRAKGGYPIEPINSNQNTERHQLGGISTVKVRKSNENYALIEVKEGLSKIGSFWGLECKVKDVSGILDCGTPHYCHGGIHTTDTGSAKVGDKIYVWNTAIGVVTEVLRNLIRFKCTPLSIYANGFSAKGLSLYSQFEETKIIKLIPRFPSDLNLKTGEDVCLKLVIEEINT